MSFNHRPSTIKLQALVHLHPTAAGSLCVLLTSGLLRMFLALCA
jgi:hypothetical protein